VAGGVEIRTLTRASLPLEHSITLRDLRSRIDGQDVHVASCSCGWVGKQRRGPMGGRLARHDGTRHLARRRRELPSELPALRKTATCRHEAVEPRHASVIRGAWNARWPIDWEHQSLGWCPACERLVSRRLKTAPHQSFRWKALPAPDAPAEPIRPGRTHVARRRW